MDPHAAARGTAIDSQSCDALLVMPHRRHVCVVAPNTDAMQETLAGHACCTIARTIDSTSYTLWLELLGWKGGSLGRHSQPSIPFDKDYASLLPLLCRIPDMYCGQCNEDRRFQGGTLHALLQSIKHTATRRSNCLSLSCVPIHLGTCMSSHVSWFLGDSGPFGCRRHACTQHVLVIHSRESGQAKQASTQNDCNRALF